MGENARATVSQKAVVFGATGDVLVLRDGSWEFPGGKMERSERARESLLREVREETGLDVTVAGPVHTVMRKRKKKRGKFTVYYRCTVEAPDADGDAPAVTLSDEHSEAAWVSPAEARDRLTKRRRREALARALADAGREGER